MSPRFQYFLPAGKNAEEVKKERKDLILQLINDDVQGILTEEHRKITFENGQFKIDGEEQPGIDIEKNVEVFGILGHTPRSRR